MAGVPEITVGELSQQLATGKPPRLVDVREQNEWDLCRIPGGELLPLSEWPHVALEKLTDKEAPLLIYCHHGGRSARATAWLLAQGFTNVQNVAGGIDAWSVEVDPTVPRYQ